MRWAVVALAVLLLAALLWFRQMPARALPEASASPVEAPVEAPDPPSVEPEGPSLRGVVFLANGNRASYAILHANLARGGEPAPVFAFADADGLFRIPVAPLPLAGVDIVVEHPPSGTPRNAFVLSGEQARAAIVELVLTSMTVSGRAVDRDGRPLPYATIEIVADTPPSAWYSRSLPDLLRCPAPQADAEGRFSLRVQQRRLTAVLHAPGLTRGVRVVAGPVDAQLGDIVVGPLPHAPTHPPTAALR